MQVRVETCGWHVSSTVATLVEIVPRSTDMSMPMSIHISVYPVAARYGISTQGSSGTALLSATPRGHVYRHANRHANGHSGVVPQDDLRQEVPNGYMSNHMCTHMLERERCIYSCVHRPQMLFGRTVCMYQAQIHI